MRSSSSVRFAPYLSTPFPRCCPRSASILWGWCLKRPPPWDLARKLPQRSRSPSVSVAIAPVYDTPEGHCKDFEVQPRRPIVDVEEVVLDALLQMLLVLHRAPIAVDLCPAGESRPHPVSSGVAIDDLFAHPAARRRPQRMWPRSHNRHLASHDVDQLGQLIEAGPANEPADSGNPGVV